MANQLAQIKKMIYDIRGQKVMLDCDLAALYEVETFNLNKAVKRNIERFHEMNAVHLLLIFNSVDRYNKHVKYGTLVIFSLFKIHHDYSIATVV